MGGKASLFRRRKRKNKQPKNEQKEVLERRMIASESDSSLMKKVTEKKEQPYIASAPLPLRGVLKKPEIVDRERSSAVLSFEQQSLIVDRSNSGSRTRNSPPRKRSIGSAFASVRFAGSVIAKDTVREISRMNKINFSQHFVERRDPTSKDEAWADLSGNAKRLGYVLDWSACNFCPLRHPRNIQICG